LDRLATVPHRPTSSNDLGANSLKSKLHGAVARSKTGVMGLSHPFD
jgi:hypothetical protein